ncbi:DUF732 domain-containing protein [Rhodococcus sp. X156]|uniref:DUF732 domain-containing protein n=1 Tax=Rhodococcus sp. X156 TaxID=2499145 RepID=UPI000FD9DDF9|nr:DUF732 domain-containing protein [Rhodococcus sp. X156]
MGKLGMALARTMVVPAALLLAACGDGSAAPDAQSSTALPSTTTAEPTTTTTLAAPTSTAAPTTTASRTQPPVATPSPTAARPTTPPLVAPTATTPVAVKDQACPPVQGLQVLTRSGNGTSAVGCADAAGVLDAYTAQGGGTRTVQGWQCASAAAGVAVTRCTKGELVLATYDTAAASAASATVNQAFLSQLADFTVPLAVGIGGGVAEQVTQALGHQVCGQLSAGTDYETIANGISGSFDYNADDARTVITASVLAICPQHKNLVGG